jgi:hypothetical protein
MRIISKAEYLIVSGGLDQAAIPCKYNDAAKLVFCQGYAWSINEPSVYHQYISIYSTDRHGPALATITIAGEQYANISINFPKD